MRHRTPHRLLTVAVLAACTLALGCDDDPEATADTDTATSAGDATSTSGDATGGDTATGSDTATGADTSTDATADSTTSADTADATATDTDPGDATATDLADGTDVVDPPVGLWDHCPSASNTGDPAWPFTVDVREGATYCAFYPEQRGFEEEYARKVMLQILPSMHTLPMESGTHPLTLSACGLVVDGTPLTTEGAGTVEVTRTTDATFDTIRYDIVQPMVDDAANPWVIEFGINLEAYIDGGETLGTSYILDDGDTSIFDSVNFNYGTLSLCQGETCDFNVWETTRQMNSCTFGNVDAERVARVDFEGGWLETTTRIGQSFASTEPAIFWHGEGEIDGVPFASDDYFELVYSPWHHHFDMDQAVRFDAPITGEICGVYGVRMPAFDPNGVVDNIEAGVLDCDLNTIETRKVTGYTVERVDR